MVAEHLGGADKLGVNPKKRQFVPTSSALLGIYACGDSRATASAGDYTYARRENQFVRWPCDAGEFGNGYPEFVPTEQVPEQIRRILPPNR